MTFPIFRAFVRHRWPSKIVCVALAIMLYLLFRGTTLTERVISIPLEVITPGDFIVSSEYPRSINLALRGNEDDVKGVLPDDVEAFVNLASFAEEGEYKLPVKFRKKGTALQPEALELRSQPRELSFTLEKRAMRSLVVRPELIGFPSLGYELTQFFVSPSSVTVVGPLSQMANVTELTTELIDLSDRREDFTVTTRIVSPSPQVEIPGGQIVEFRGVVDEVVVIRTIEDRELVIFDLPDGLSIAGELPPVRLTVQGKQLVVEGVRPQDMTFYIDGSQIRSPGTYVLPLITDIPSTLAVLQLEPREVEIQVVRTGGGGPVERPAEPTPPPEPEQVSDEAQPFGTVDLPAFAPVNRASEEGDL